MQKVPLNIKDASGGLNDRDPPSAIAANQLARLRNGLTDEMAFLTKRGGQDLLQHAPVDPQVFAADGNTVGLWHLDDAAAPWTDSGANGYDLRPVYTGPVTAAALFPIGAGKGAKFGPTTADTDHGPIFKSAAAPLNGQNQVTIQGWVNLDAVFSGKPFDVTRFGVAYSLSNSGAVLWGTCAFAADAINPGALVNGVTVHQDWDAVAGKPIGSPYLKFTLNTNGIAGTTTVITSTELTLSRLIHIKATYNSGTGLMQLYVLGSLVASAIPAGGGTINDAGAAVIAMGGGFSQSYTPTLPTTDSAITCLFAVGNTIYVGGGFSLVNGTIARNCAFAFDAVTGSVLPWNPNLDGSVLSMAVSGNMLYLAGTFAHVNGLPGLQVGACAVDLINGTTSAWNPQLNDYAYAVSVSGASVYLGGAFTLANGVVTVRNHACAVDMAAGTLTAWDPNLNANVNALVVSGAKIYMAGNFTTANGGTARNRGCSVDLVTGTLNAWDPNCDGAVLTLLISGTTVYMGGFFNNANVATARNYACAVDSVTGTLTAWDPNLGNSVSALAISGSVVYIGGSFITANGATARKRVAAVDATTGTLNGWNPVSNTLVQAVLNFNSVILFGNTGVRAWYTPLYNVANLIADEWMVSLVEIATFPFKNFRGKPMPFSKSDGTRQILAAAEEGLYYSNGDSDWTLITNLDATTGDLMSPTAQWDARSYGDIIYLANGINTPLAWDGIRVVPWGEPVSPATLTEAAGAGTMTAGAHKVKLLYLYGGDRTGPGPEADVTTTGGNLNVSDMPTRHSNCSAIEVYMTKAGGSIYYLARVIDNDSTVNSMSISGAFATPDANPETDTGAIGVPDATLGTGFYTVMSAQAAATAIGKPKYLLPEHDRMFSGGDDDTPYFLRYSALGNPDVFLASAYTRLRADSGEILGFASSHGEIVISKGGKSTSVLRGSDESNWTLTENLHPKVGAVDHWSFVHRYPANGGPYVLCSVCPDGVYEYDGQSMNKVSDFIRGTFGGLSAASATRADWLTTQLVDFQQARNLGGSASQNIQADVYQTDGMREAPGKVKIVDQLNYLGLWGGSTGQSIPAGSTNGKVLFMAKGPAEGQFFFSFDNDNRLWQTTDNWQTVAPINTGLAAADRIIEIVYASIGGDDQYFCFTAGTGTGGALFVYDATQDAWSLVNAGPFYWQADVPWQIYGDQYGTFAAPAIPNGSSSEQRTFDRVGNGGGIAGQFDFVGGKNIFLTHDQGIRLGFPNGSGRLNVEAQTSITSANLVYGAAAFAQGSFEIMGSKTAYADASRVPLASGYYGIHDDTTWRIQNYSSVASAISSWNSRDSTGGFDVQFTRRETAFYLGGTFRPQAFWDGVNQKIIFAAGDALDGNSNTTSHIWSATLAGVLTSIISAQSYYALATDGVTCWFTDQAFAAPGFQASLKKFALANTGVITTVAALAGNYLPLRLAYNASNGTLYCGGKVNQYHDSFNCNGFLASLTTAGVFTVLKTFAANGGVGAFPVELAYQTSTPYSVFASVANLAAPDVEPIQHITAANVVTPEISQAFNGATGIRSNLLFVAASGAAGNHLWADRLYWSNLLAGLGDGYPVQLGVEGDWDVIGHFLSRQNDLGSFNAFGNFGADYTGPQVDFFMRNAATPAALAASEAAITPNKRITGFYPTAEFAQWRAQLTWSYRKSLGTVTVSPSIAFVDIGYFLGNPNIPRVVAEHYLGRTYFCVSENGQAENNLVLVYDKKNAWTVYEGWNIKGLALFRNQLVAFQGYNYVALESGDRDLGKLISQLARTGAMMGDSDVRLDDVAANVQTFVNADFATASGFILVTAYAGEVPLPGQWSLEIPASDKVQPRRVPGKCVAGYKFGWGNAFSLEIKTSDLTTGKFVAAGGQREVIAEIDAKLFTTEPTRSRTVN